MDFFAGRTSHATHVMVGTMELEPLPVGDYEFVPEDELSALDPAALDFTQDKGYVFEVDLEYPGRTYHPPHTR